MYNTSVYRRLHTVFLQHVNNGGSNFTKIFYHEEEINNGDFTRMQLDNRLLPGSDYGNCDGSTRYTSKILPEVGYEGSTSPIRTVREFTLSGTPGKRDRRTGDLFARLRKNSASEIPSTRLYGRREHDPIESDRILELARSVCRKREIIRSTIPFASIVQLHSILGHISRGNINRGGPGFRLFGVHWENEACTLGHLHIYHDCNTNHGACRCSFLQGLNQPVLHAKGRVVTASFTKWDIARIIIYLCTGKRQPTHLFLDDRRTAIPTKTSLLSNPGLAGSTGEGPMEEIIRGHDAVFFGDEPGTSCSGAIVRDSGVGGARRRWVNVGKESLTYEAKMYAFMQNNYVVPLDSIVRTRRWLESSFKFVRSSERTFQTVIDTINAEWIPKDLEGIDSFWRSKEYVFWEDPEWCNINGARYDLQSSIDIAKQLLIFQYGSEEGITGFLQDVYDVLMRRHPKRNALEVQSPPSAGKNFFFDPIFLWMGSVGQVANMSRNNQFGFDNCFNKRVCIMNEPRFENASREQLLMFLGGDVFSAQGKYKSVSDIVRTPVIILTNSSPFPHAPQWDDRMFRHRWRRCAMLKDCTKKLCPSFFINLCRQYSVQ